MKERAELGRMVISVVVLFVVIVLAIEVWFIMKYGYFLSPGGFIDFIRGK
jgi:hypothetical protein